VWVFLFGDMLVFGTFFATFLYRRSRAPDAFDAARHTLHMGVGVTNTLVLLTSSLLVVTAIRAVRTSRARIAQKLFGGAIACGLAFVGLKAVEYTAMVSAGHVPSRNEFYQYYFILTGIHLLHVVIGIAVLIALLYQARHTRLSTTQIGVVEAGACFWHLVDLLWILLFPLLYLVS